MPHLSSRPTILAVAIVLLALGMAASASSLPAASIPLKPRVATVALPTLTRQGLVLPMGDPMGEDGEQVGYPSVLAENGTYKMWYFEVQASPWTARIAYASSPDGRNWTKHGAVLVPTLPNEFNDVAYPTVLHVNGTYWMWYNGWDGLTYRIFAATSPDGINWTKQGVVLDVGPAGSPDSASLAYPFALYENGTFYLWYTGLTSFTPGRNAAIMLATSTNGLNWTKWGVVLTEGPVGSIDGFNVFTSGVVRFGSTFVMTYMGQYNTSSGRVLWATSFDGMHWTKTGIALSPDPPQEDSVGQADPIIGPDGIWRIYYAVRNYTTDIQIYLATGSLQSVSPPPPGGGGSSGNGTAPGPTPLPSPNGTLTPPNSTAPGPTGPSNGLGTPASAAAGPLGTWAPLITLLLAELLGASVAVGTASVVLWDRRHR